MRHVHGLSILSTLLLSVIFIGFDPDNLAVGCRSSGLPRESLGGACLDLHTQRGHGRHCFCLRPLCHSCSHDISQDAAGGCRRCHARGPVLCRARLGRPALWCGQGAMAPLPGLCRPCSTCCRNARAAGHRPHPFPGSGTMSASKGDESLANGSPRVCCSPVAGPDLQWGVRCTLGSANPADALSDCRPALWHDGAGEARSRVSRGWNTKLPATRVRDGRT